MGGVWTNIEGVGSEQSFKGWVREGLSKVWRGGLERVWAKFQGMG